MEKADLTVQEAHFRVSVYLSKKADAQNLFETLERCGYTPQLDFVPDKNLEKLQDYARRTKK